MEDVRAPRVPFAGGGGGQDPFTRVPPQNLEAEQNVLGAMLLSADAVNRVLEILKAPDVFYRKSHQIVYEAVRALSERNEPIDLVTVSNHLEAAGRMDEVGGRLHLADLYNAVASPAHAEYYARIVLDKALRRALIRVGASITELGYQEEEDVEALIDKAEQLVFDLGQRRTSADFTHVEPVLHEVFEKAEMQSLQQGIVVGTPTGFYDLDKLLAGMQPGNLVILGARPSMGKCLAADSEIVLGDGSVSTIEDIYMRRDADLLTLGSDWKLGLTKPSAYVDDGIKPVFKVTTRLGRTLETTASHPYLTLEGWRPLFQLSVGTRIAVPRKVEVFGRERLRDCEVSLLGYLLGDGGLTGSLPLFPNSSERISDEFNFAIEEFGGIMLTAAHREGDPRAPSYRIVRDMEHVARKQQAFAARLAALIETRGLSMHKVATIAGLNPGTVRYWLKGTAMPKVESMLAACAALEINPESLTGEPAPAGSSSGNPLRAWLEGLGLYGKGSHAKFVPDVVFRLERDQVARFLNRLFATDGWASVDKQGAVQIGYCSVSERLLRQVQHLLLRFGVIAAAKRKRVKYKGQHRFAWQLIITDIRSIETFSDEIGIYGKEEALARVRTALDRHSRKPNRDTLPPEIWSLIRAAKGAESWSSLARSAGIEGWSNMHVGKRGISRGRLARLAKALGSPELEALAGSDVYWDEIVAIESMGSKQVYDLTIPDTHNFVANDICVHNTSLAMSVARNAAAGSPDLPGKPVILFSLEMSREELVTRLLCSEARVNMLRLKQGFLTEDDWPKLLQGIGRLQDFPIYLDDTAAITVMEVRSKCRKLMTQLDQELGLVLIDYLQLMDSPQTSRYPSNDNRANEVAKISRSLKALARELGCPVMAMSQLARAAEQTKDKKPMLSHLRESGCLTADTRVTRADTGQQVTMGELLESGARNIPVWALNQDHQLIPANMTHVFPSGTKPVFKLRLASGLEVKASGNHPFLTIDGWKALDELSVGTRLAVPWRLPEPLEPDMSWQDDQVVMLAHLIGDGCFLKGQPLHYTNADPANLVAVENAARFWGVTARRVKQKNWWHVYLPAPYRLTHGKRNPICAWLDELGLFGKRSREKFLPGAVQSLPRRQAALFLRHLWATDGHLGLAKSGQVSLYYASSSRRLIEDVRQLLLRFEIPATVRLARKEGYDPTYQLWIQDSRSQAAFLKEIGVHGARGDRSVELLTRIDAKQANPNADTIPIEIWSQVKRDQAKVGLTSRTYAEAIGSAYCGTALYKHAPNRPRLLRVAEAVHSLDMAALALSDMFWDRIVGIDPIGEDFVFDATVEGCHNFIAGGIIAHNSIEQDADIVMFIHRDDYYNEMSEYKNQAEIIVAKNRNGPTGSAMLYFHKEFTLFDNLYQPGATS